MGGTGGISDHYPIYLEILGPPKKPKAPFKFNHDWLQDPTYINMVKELWTQNPIDRSDTLAKGFCSNLSQLKHLFIKWAREKCQKENSALLLIKSELSTLSDEIGLGFSTAEDKIHLVELENKKSKILKDQEESIRLRSRSIWLKAGDDNTQFFHNYEKGRKVKNTIWNIPFPKGGVADSNKLSPWDLLILGISTNNLLARLLLILSTLLDTSPSL